MGSLGVKLHVYIVKKKTKISKGWQIQIKMYVCLIAKRICLIQEPTNEKQSKISLATHQQVIQPAKKKTIQVEPRKEKTALLSMKYCLLNDGILITVYETIPT